jgi:hypothetical protein
MIISNENKFIKFREKLYNTKVSKLLQKGSKGLKPLEKYKFDEKGRTLVPTKEIIRFFFQQIKKAGHPDSNEFFDSLFTLLQVMTRGAEPISYDCGFSISQEKIQEADNKTTIELLTTNIIITYFNNLKDYKGEVDKNLLAPGLKDLIAKSNQGRDYKVLVENTLAALTDSLAEDKPWQEYIEEINDVDLICRLAGASLPSLEKETLAKIVGHSRREILGYNDIFTKLLHTREQAAIKEPNTKKYLKTMEKLRAAILGTLKKIDIYLASAHRLMTILDLTPQTVLGKTDDQLKQNLVWLFLDAKPDMTNQADILNEMGIAPIRYRLNMLFTFPEITRYCRALKSMDGYEKVFFDGFRLLFQSLTRKMNQLDMDTGKADLRLLSQSLKEISRAADKLGLEESHLPDEKSAVRNAYLALIHKIDFQHLDTIMATSALVCDATQDQTKEIMVSIRAALVEACFSTLSFYAQEVLSADKARNGIKKRLHAYAMYYKPQREFYRIFFDTYVGSKSNPVSPHLAQFIKANKHFAAALLMVFSDDKSMKELVPVNQTTHAADLLTKLRDNS